ncbi:CapA family protein [Clostridium sp. MB40-C1]|uniref:CapA family protein n=1 Tax=Clostridium sp. MB40-C1 TaxID=3070996 RepID=UPI0027DFEFD9|nr:CapA family protein [Clostridium sp. MB40-C1]WMJ80708.1 CapA family protein [Clostridium sp. MB40-C1]
MGGVMPFTAVGDCFITRKLPNKNESFLKIASIIQKGEACFMNLEVTIHDHEGFPAAVSGGTWAMAPPKVLNDLKEYGFNLVSWANNHTLDYSSGGLEATERYLNEYGFVHAGAGKNLALAASPKYLECPSGRVALIAATSTIHESGIAGEQRRDMCGRPGVNPLRYQSMYFLNTKRLDQLKEIAEISGINAKLNVAKKEGFFQNLGGNSFMFGRYLFVEGTQEGLITVPMQKDLARIINAIYEAKRQADYVIVSIHSHEMKGEFNDQPAEFLQLAARKCIDAGAHSVIGHGPHVLRGIEIYKKCPIFYSLGNFIFQNETVIDQPHDFYNSYGLGHTSNIADALDRISNNNTRGFGANEDVWQTIIPFWTMENGELKELKLYPIELGFNHPRYRRGWPKVSNNTEILQRIRKLSLPFGTNIEIGNCIGKVNL